MEAGSDFMKPRLERAPAALRTVLSLEYLPQLSLCTLNLDMSQSLQVRMS